MRPLRVGRGTLRQVQHGHDLSVRARVRLILVHNRSLFASPRAFADRGGRADKSDLTVNYFEDEVRGQHRKRRRIDPDRDAALDAALAKESEELSLGAILEDISADNEELENFRKNVFSEEDLSRMKELDITADYLLPYHVSPQTIIPRQAQACLTRLNENFDTVTAHPNDTDRKAELWRWYRRCKMHVPGFLRMIPKPAWDLLWQSSARDSPFDPGRAQRLRMFADDKLAVDWTLTPEEQYARLEGLFLDGKRGVALAEWEDLFDDRSRSNKDFLEMGVRMYATDGQPKRAHEELQRIFALDQSANPRLLVSVIKAFVAQKSETSLLQAYELYQEMRQRLSSDINMGDFDIVSLEFLAAGRTDFALAVFRDMIIYGEGSKQGLRAFDGSEAASRVAEFVSLGSAQESTNFSLDAIKYLPRRFQNKFFYASWLKKLIGEGHIEAAGQVVELMYERGIRPDARHINGIIVSLSRMDDQKARIRAEELAWAMIQQRVKFTERRRHGLLGSNEDLDTRSKLVTDNNEGIVVPIQMDRPVPMATIETFSILLQYYARRQQFAHVRHLRDLLVDAEIPMNSYFMNHILYAEMRSRGYQYAFARFDVMSKTVTPDLETFLCLWQCMKTLIFDMRNQQRRDFSGFPNHRQLFAQMMAWLDGLQGQPKAAALQDMTQEIYHHILRAFSIAHDLRGIFVAIYALRQRFGCLPEEETIRMLLLMFSQLQPITPNQLPKARTRHMRRQRVGRKDVQVQERDISQAGVILSTVREDRMRRYRDEEIEWVDLTADQQAEENYRLTLEMVWTVLRRSEGAAETQADRVAAAAKDMNVEKFDAAEAMQLLVDD